MAKVFLETGKGNNFIGAKVIQGLLYKPSMQGQWCFIAGSYIHKEQQETLILVKVASDIQYQQYDLELILVSLSQNIVQCNKVSYTVPF